MIFKILNAYGWLIILLASKLLAQRKIRPTNSVTIRKSGTICQNHGVGEFVENPDDCQLFYLCVDSGEAVIATCPPTMLFNPESKLCDAATSVKCEILSNTQKPNQTITIPNNDLDVVVTDAATYCARLAPQLNEDRIVYVGSSSSCSQYYICYYGQAILQECSMNLHWNANTGKCDLPEKSQCTLQSTELSALGNGSNNLNTGLEFIHCPVYGQHIFPHMERCEFFIYCVKGHAILQQCPFYYHFDIVTKSCQWLRTAVCVRDLNLNFRYVYNSEF